MIIQVVIGVVIGGIILFYLPSFIVFGIFGVVALIGLVVGAVTLVWLYDNPSAILLIGILTAVLLMYRHYKKEQFARSTAGAIKRIEENIIRRRSNGYDNNALYSELNILQEKLASDEKELKRAEFEAKLVNPDYIKKLNPKPKSVSDKVRRKEYERRKKLGYED